MSALLWSASQFRDKVRSPPLGYQTVAQACIHVRKTWPLFSHTAQPGPLSTDGTTEQECDL